jgi:hypothetical protein
MTEVADGVSVVAATQDGEEKCPKCLRAKHDSKYARSMSERRKALIRDAADPTSNMTQAARDFVKNSGGANVPTGYEVSHEEPLYTKPHSERCELDVEDNLKTEPKPQHRARHKRCGDQYHRWPPANYKF